MARGGRAFSVVELLVVIAVAAMLVGILLPVLGGAREAGRQAACGAMERTLYIGAMAWSVENKSALPGVNTTGRRFLGQGLSVVGEMLFDSTPDMPTSVFDWISPSVGESAKLHPNRAVRTKQIFENLGCASAKVENQTLYGTAPDKASDFEPLLRREGIGQVSYLAPGPFHLTGPADGAAQTGRRYGWHGPAIPPQKYKPRLDRVGTQLASKVFVADGTRYVARSGKLDFDVDPTPQYYGSFTESSPIYEASTAYGEASHRPQFPGERRESSSNYPKNRNLSYRHRGRINVLFFDGHLGTMDEATSKTDAAPWFPTGSTFTAVRATPESKEFHKVGEKLR